MSGWYLRQGDRRTGPFPVQQVRQRLADGRLPDGVLVWRPGLACWQPALVHFPPRARAADGLRLALGLLAIGVMVVLVTRLQLHGLEDFGSLRAGLGAWGALLLGLLAVALATAAFAWRRARRLQPFRPVAAALQRTGALVGLMVAFGVAIVQAVGMPLLYPNLALREGFRDYRIEAVRVGERDALLARGSIGPGFRQALAQSLARHPEARLLVIDSPGGLVDEALAVVDLLRDAGLDTLARGECSSACVMVLLGGERRYAEPGLALGLHGVSNIDRDARDGQAAVEAMGRLAWRMMREAGMPAAVLEEARGYQANEMMKVPVVDLVALGVLDGLVGADGATVSLEQAQWQDIQALYRAADPDDPMAGLMTLVGVTRPQLASRWAGSIHAALRAGASERASRQVAAFAGTVLSDALGAASDEAVVRFYAGMLAELEDARVQASWDTCADIVFARPGGAGSSARVNRQIALLLELAEAAAATGWAPGKHDMAAAEGRALLASLPAPGPESRQQCLSAIAVYQRALELPESRAGPLLRWLAAGSAREDGSAAPDL
ncbi:MAG: GYF domain-containing protein [Lysobacteraceae bacterium]